MFKKTIAGIYFGSQGLSIVEYNAKALKNYLYASYPKDIKKPGGPEITKESLFEAFLDNEVEIVAFVSRSLRDTRIDVDSADIVVGIPNRDLVVRFFEMPPIPRKDLKASIGFEIKKYIPFKTEEISYDYQIRNKANINEVLFAGIKNEDLDKYSSIIKQANIKCVAIEPSQFSLLRLLKYKKVITEKESVVITELRKDDCSILIVDEGMPYFSRDVKIAATGETEQIDMDSVIFRMINEVRVSIDYFRRQFMKKGIDRVLVLSRDESRELINNFNKELGLKVQYKNPDDICGVKDEYSLELARALGASLRISNPLKLTINLKKESKSATEGAASPQQMLNDALLEFLDIPKATMIKVVAVAVAIIAGVFLLSSSRVTPLRQEVDSLAQKNNSVLIGNLTSMDAGSLTGYRDSERNRLNVYRSVLDKDSLFSEKLMAIPRLLPSGVWINEISYNSGQKYVYMSGTAYNDDGAKAANAPYEFINNLKASSLFMNKVKDISLKSLRNSLDNSYEVVNFEIDIYLE